ncbi:hypothetical protein ABT095_03160 [Kitasatospora sp. NPDC002227]|uniref:hypothetical protein n=1 Tax=Kitasatospora sp. NPDC002227 TaxID=3154773 RepID=UPI00332D9D9C
MRINRRIGVLAAGAVLAGGLLPVQAASAESQLGQLGLTCDSGAAYRAWSSAQPFDLKAGEDAASLCRVMISGLPAEGVKGLKASYMISAESVKSTGHTPEELARLISVRGWVDDAAMPLVSGVWGFGVDPDGSLTLQSPSFDLLPHGSVPALGQVDFEFTAASTKIAALLHGEFTITSDKGLSNMAPADLNYIPDGKTTTVGTAGTFKPVTPVRALDTRHAIGAPKAPVGPGGEVTLQVAGANGIPATGVTAVVLNVTATNPTTGGYVTVYPHGRPRPTASNLNFTAGQTVPNLVTVPVVDGKINLYNFAGTTDLIGDISGYYTSDGTGSRYTPAGPTRIMDNRTTPVGQGGQVDLQITGKNGVPATGVTSVVLNVTTVGPTTGGYVTVYPHGQERPTASNLNFGPGQTVANLVSVPVGADGKVSLYNFAGKTGLVADLAGYYSGTGSVFVPSGPTRILDTRSGLGHGTSTIGAVGGGRTLNVTADSWANGIPPVGVTAVALNVTATRATTGGYVTVFGGEQAKPLASNLNFLAKQTVPNAVITQSRQGVNFFNAFGDTDLIADLAGYFTAN